MDASRLMLLLFKKKKHIYTVQGKNADFLKVKAGGVHNDPCGLEV
jgi:hypothetical protein